MQNFDVLILGAGIVGCAIARECAMAGMQVGIVEKDSPGRGSTAAGMGHIVVMDDSPAQLALSQYSRSLWQGLQSVLPSTAEYESRGTLWIASNEEEMAEVHAKHSAYTAVGIRTTVLDSAAVALEEPNLRPGLAGGLLVPDDGVVYPPTVATFFLQQAQAQGAVFLSGYEAIRAEHGSVRLTNGTTLVSGSIVLATGIGTQLLPWLPIQKRKGHLLITDRYPGFIHHQLVELGYLKSAHKLTSDSVAFNVQPRRTGQLLIGSSRQYDNDNTAVDPLILGAMLERARSYMPALTQLSSIRVWTGFRAATPDKLPLIGPTDDPTLFLAMGFEGLGITNAPGTARLLLDHLLQRPSAIDARPYLPMRNVMREFPHA